jgi:hypothetical protein
MFGFIIKGCKASNDESDYHSKGKGKVRTSHKGPKGEQRYTSTPSLTLALDGGWSTPCPAPLPLERPGTHCIGGLGGPQERSGQVRKILSPPGLDPQTAQPVANRYTD